MLIAHLESGRGCMWSQSEYLVEESHDNAVNIRLFYKEKMKSLMFTRTNWIIAEHIVQN